MNTIIVSDPSIAHALRGALCAIDYFGWGQGEYQNDDGQVCLYGAIHFVVTGTPHSYDVSEDDEALIDEAVAALRRVTDAAECGGITGWNDETFRTLDDVRLALRSAIEQATSS